MARELSEESSQQPTGLGYQSGPWRTPCPMAGPWGRQGVLAGMGIFLHLNFLESFLHFPG